MGTNFQAETGRQIRRLRQEAELTIEELAFRAKLHPNYLGDIERGDRNPTILNLKKIAEALNRPVADIFGKARVAARSAERRAVYLSADMDEALISLLKSLRKNEKKDQAYIIQSAKTLSAKLRKGR